MSFFSRLIGTKEPRDPVPCRLDERAMEDQLRVAKRRNREAAETMATAADRQAQDAILIRQVIGDILDRADPKKLKKAGRTIG